MEPYLPLRPPFSRLALKNRKRIGERGEPCGRPACGSSVCLEASPFTTMVALRSEQKASIHLTQISGIHLSLSRCKRTSFATPFISKKARPSWRLNFASCPPQRQERPEVQ